MSRKTVTEEMKEDIRALLSIGYTYLSIRKKLGCSNSTISQVKKTAAKEQRLRVLDGAPVNQETWFVIVGIVGDGVLPEVTKYKGIEGQIEALNYAAACRTNGVAVALAREFGFKAVVSGSLE